MVQNYFVKDWVTHREPSRKSMEKKPHLSWLFQLERVKWKIQILHSVKGAKTFTRPVSVVSVHRAFCSPSIVQEEQM